MGVKLITFGEWGEDNYFHSHFTTSFDNNLVTLEDQTQVGKLESPYCPKMGNSSISYLMYCETYWLCIPPFLNVLVRYRVFSSQTHVASRQRTKITEVAADHTVEQYIFNVLSQKDLLVGITSTSWVL